MIRVLQQHVIPCNPDGSEMMEFGYRNLPSASISAAAERELVHGRVCVGLSTIPSVTDIPNSIPCKPAAKGLV